MLPLERIIFFHASLSAVLARALLNFCLSDGQSQFNISYYRIRIFLLVNFNIVVIFLAIWIYSSLLEFLIAKSGSIQKVKKN